jgi:CRISPR-associated protein Cas8a1/Csx13
MAQAVKSRPAEDVPELLVRLHAPGMSTLLRAGAGGLAASLRALLSREHPGASWPSPVPLGPGSATVEPSAVRLSWGGRPPEETLEVLFRESFRLRAPLGLIELPGTVPPGTEFKPELAAALQDALKLTFLQHGSTTDKDGPPRPHTFTVDEREVALEVQGYASFVHQGAWKDVAEALHKGSIALAGWAYPGAAERHIGLRVTKMEYTAAEALCACFALVGCLSYKAPGRMGALVALAPSDLVRFAEVRPHLTPGRLEDVSVAGGSDAVLAVQLALRMGGHQGAHRVLASAEAFTLRVLPWATQQKSRGGVVHTGVFSDDVLDRYDTAARELRNRLRVLAPKAPKKGQGAAGKAPERAGFFVASSALRAFITENLAAGRPWYADFASATDTERRFIHHYRAEDNLGALFPEERKGLIAMLKHLEDNAEQALVESVHVALRQRFGAIAEESQGNRVAMRNRMNGERERWRLAFAGAKTADQVRAALADLWSRAGPNRTLQEHWKDVLPLLRAERWRAARDLALVALASYARQESEPGEDSEEAPPSDAE